MNQVRLDELNQVKQGNLNQVKPCDSNQSRHNYQNGTTNANDGASVGYLTEKWVKREKHYEYINEVYPNGSHRYERAIHTKSI